MKRIHIILLSVALLFPACSSTEDIPAIEDNGNTPGNRSSRDRRPGSGPGNPGS